MPRRKSSKTLVALGSAAVVAVYTAGYLYTSPAVRQVEAGRTENSPENAKLDRRAYRDGSYFGWGTCRHGDLQAELVIKDGRIIAASISQCLTRYSKDVIAALPGQVVTRQSAAVDRISRATQSSDAFHDAVIEALAQAK